MKLFARWLPLLGFGGSRNYWESRYGFGGDSGAGSQGEAAIYKANVINSFIGLRGVKSVIEFGCGDGRQLLLSAYPRYVGVDVSVRAVQMCEERFASDPSKRFEVLDLYNGETAELSLSLDVIYHLVEDQVYRNHLDQLFRAATRYVVIYSTSAEHKMSSMRHVRHRKIEDYIMATYPHFKRMVADESALPPPVERSRAGYTRFFLFERTD